MIRNYFKFGTRIFLKVIVFIIVFLIIVIHPNDSRLDFERPVEKSENKAIYSRIGSLWQNNIDLEFQGLPDGISQDLKGVLDGWPSTATMNLKRFKYKNQVYITFGRYPEHLEGRDALYLPMNGSVLFKLKQPGVQRVEFGFGGTRDGDKVAVSIGDKLFHEYEYRKMTQRVHLLKKLISPWLWPDILLKQERWQDYGFDVEVANEVQIKFTCQSLGSGCFISDLDIFAHSKAKKNQVIVVLVDTLRFDGIDEKKTPLIAHLKNQSINFEHAVSPGNMTSPSTNAFLSCTPPTFLGSWAFSYGVSPEQREGFATQAAFSWPNQLAIGGMKTGMIGNISVVSEVMGVGQNHGFEQQQSIEFDGYDTPIIANEAQKWIIKNEDRSFLLYVHFNAPHAPYRPPLRDIFNVWPDKNPLRSYPTMLNTLYDAELLYTDRYLRKVVDTLKARNLYDSITLIITADHGDQMIPRIFPGNQSGPSLEGSYHDHGATLLNDEVRVPLIFKMPKEANSSPKVISNWVSTIQVGQTLLEEFRSHPPKSDDHQCFLPALPLAVREGYDSGVIPIEGFRERGILYDNRWKYIRSYASTNKRMYKKGSFFGNMSVYFRRERLFDLNSDPDELRDLSDNSPAQLEIARDVYRKAYRLKTGYEIVVETPFKEAVSVEIAEGAVLKETVPPGKMNGGRFIYFNQGQSERYSIRLDKLGPTLPVIMLNNKVIPLFYTMNRLALSSDTREILDILPFEEGGEKALLPLASKPRAYLRKLWDIDREEPVIQSNNPEFEKMLREWGYLNDN